MINQASANQDNRASRTSWLIALFVGFLVAYPFAYVAMAQNPHLLIGVLAGDSYHYLAIARKALESGIYTYDGVHVTNGFHPLWQYSARGLFTLFNFTSHEQQALALISLSVTSCTLGAVFASMAIQRLTGQKYLGLLVIPGIFYLTFGVHVQTLSVWSTVDGMESAYSLLFGGLFFYVMSKFNDLSDSAEDLIGACKKIGFILPFMILSRLDDVFIIPAFYVPIYLHRSALPNRISAAFWLSFPAGVAVICYLIYNIATVGAAMPLSGSTKFGFAGFTTAYLTGVMHFPPLLDLKNLVSVKQSDGATLFPNFFRLAEVFYPLVAAGFGLFIVLKNHRNRPMFLLLAAICGYMVIKMSYNFFFVNAWHQSSWYYGLANISISVLGAMLVNEIVGELNFSSVGRAAFATLYGLLMLFTASLKYFHLAYPTANELKYWDRKDEIRAELVTRGAMGILNVDDGIGAFLLDLPSIHGFAFATDTEAQKAYREGKMLAVASARGINVITGDYLATDLAPLQTDLVGYLKSSLAWETMRNEAEHYDFSLLYYDAPLRLPFIAFKPKTDAVN